MQVGFFLGLALETLFLTVFRSAKGQNRQEIILKKKSKAGGFSKLIEVTIIIVMFDGLIYNKPEKHNIESQTDPHLHSHFNHHKDCTGTLGERILSSINGARSTENHIY